MLELYPAKHKFKKPSTNSSEIALVGDPDVKYASRSNLFQQREEICLMTYTSYIWPYLLLDLGNYREFDIRMKLRDKLDRLVEAMLILTVIFSLDQS